jgi:hypothetical protein
VHVDQSGRDAGRFPASGRVFYRPADATGPAQSAISLSDTMLA